MPLEELFRILDKNNGPDCNEYVVRLAYKYDHEDHYTVSNEVMAYDPYPNTEDSRVIWLNDWNEGQTDVYVISFVSINELMRDYGFPE